MTDIIKRNRRGKEKFQSLFWWILYCDNARELQAGELEECFNPCFGGSYIVTRQGQHRHVD